MKRHRHSPTRSFTSCGKASGCSTKAPDRVDVLRPMEVSEWFWNRWRSQYGGMKANDAKGLKELAERNF